MLPFAQSTWLFTACLHASYMYRRILFATGHLSRPVASNSGCSLYLFAVAGRRDCGPGRGEPAWLSAAEWFVWAISAPLAGAQLSRQCIGRLRCGGRILQCADLGGCRGLRLPAVPCWETDEEETDEE
jgi:hypothetical protein